ncbi:MAG: glutathione S-transferase family protein [Sandaracinaceae bacterium]
MRLKDTSSTSSPAGEHSTPAYLSVNPLGTVPVAVLDGEAVVESAALALIAATEGAERSLLPQLGSAAWRRALQWVVFGPAELDHALVVLNQQRLFLPPGQRNPEVRAQAEAHLNSRAERIRSALESGPYLLGDSFTVADVVVDPVLSGYLTRLQERPAFQEVYGGEIKPMADPHAG